MKKSQTPTIAEVIARRRERLLLAEDLKNLVARVLVIAIAGWLLFTQVFLITRTIGQSMFPALKDGDLAIVFRLQETYARDDVISYTVDGQRYLGRIIARETDVVTMDDTGSLLVNGTTQSGEIMYPTYAKDGIEYPFRVPAGCVFVLGDYRTQAQDSRDFGAIPMENVEGKVITILRRRGL